jgi:DNA gyrase subunit B
LNSGVRIILEDLRPAEPLRSELYYDGGVREFVKYLDRSKSSIMEEPIYVKGTRDDIGVEVAMWWNDTYHEMSCPSPITSHSVTAAPIWRASEGL